ncbi:hypothetical protein D9Q98_005643 [Chlorella vulgaris]|uniref:Uncharacterized protein n=1 Tax=Chlorella vulgaris TaxID=3077 RepID=A0A9D4TN34_CHLVU|nr:hypothetical protein D9Q98_005643 [Chlorella vulgaris]
MVLCSVNVQCSQAGQGFGDGGSKQPRSPATKPGKRRKEVAGVKSGDNKAVQRAVKLVEEQEGKGRRPSGTRPVDPREASRGKVEYVKVTDWGSGNPEELGGLQMDGNSQVVETGGNPDQPFYEALARRLELLQKQGALGVAQLPGGKPLPDFQRWAFARDHYLQYLSDMHAVHAALEGSIARAAQEVAAPSSVAAGTQQQQRLLQWLGLFGAEQGLDRAEPLLQDLAAVRPQQEHISASSSSSSNGGSSSAHSPTQHAAAYASYISSLGRLCRAAEGPQELEEAVLRLLGNAFIVLLMHLTSGGRIAAAAAQKLDLAAGGALAFHSSYPVLDARLGEGAKPLEAFVSATNSLGAAMDEDQREGLMEELGKAMTKTSMLLMPLAREA